MTPESVREWANALTAPVALVLITIGVVSVCKYLAKQFVNPLGGADGRIAQFIVAMQQSVVDIPKALSSLENAFREVGSVNQDLLIRLGKQSNELSNQVTDTSKDVRRLLRANHRACDAIREITYKLHPEHSELMERHLQEIERLLDTNRDT